MDDKAGRREKAEENGPRRKQVRNYGQRVWKFLQTHKNMLFTSFMLLLVVVLLFGIFSQLQSPTISSTPSGETTLDYSTFVQQVKAGNVLAVSMQDNDIQGLLAAPLAATTTSSSSRIRHVQLSSKAIANDYTLWTRYLADGDSSWVGSGGATPIDPARAIYTRVPAGGDATLMPLLLANHVRVSTVAPSQTSVIVALLWRVGPLVLVALFFLIFLVSRNNTRSTRSLDERVTQIGRSRARRFVRAKEANLSHARETSTLPPQMRRPPTPVRPAGQTPGKPGAPRVNTEPPVTFADVAGIDEVRAELEEIVQFLRSPERFDRLGARIPRGALLVGPPGTGKTLLARAVAGEANVPFFSMSASEFVEMFVGVGASRVRDLFNQARQVAPCVIFIDELDAVGRKRTMRVMGNDERDQTLNQLLVELDGFDARKAVVVIAATNRVDILDKALLRPGRFDRRITVSVPDRAGREAILKIHTRRCPLHEDVSLERLARLTTGMTGADLANLVNEAALAAARRDLEHITDECFEDALARVQLGALRPLLMGERERRVIAVHEGGHALVAYHLPEADTVNRVTILPRGQSLGVTQFIAEEDRYNYSREMLMTRIAVGLGGRVAEELTFGAQQVTTGAENDLQVVTNLARRMVTRWGMSERVGVVFADAQDEGAYALNMRLTEPGAAPARSQALAMDAGGRLVPSGAVSPAQWPRRSLAMSARAPHSSGGIVMSALIDAEVQHILKEGHAMARAVLTEHRDQLMLLAETLLEREQLDRASFETLLQEGKLA